MTENSNGKVGRWALYVIGVITAAWIIAVSGGLIRAEVREARLCAIEKIVDSMKKSVDDLSNIRDDLRELVRRLNED